MAESDGDGGLTSDDVFIVGGVVDASKIRGSMIKWARAKNEAEMGDVRYNPEDGPIPSMVHDYKTWVNDQVEDNFWDFINEHEIKDEVKEDFINLLDSNDEFKELCDNILLCVEPTGATVGRGFNPKEKGEDGGSDEDKVADNQYPELTDAGIYDPIDGVDIGKLKGSILAYVRQNDELLGESEEPNIPDLRTGWVFWMSDVIGGEWGGFLLKHVNYDDVDTWIRQWRINRDGFWRDISSKWKHEEGAFEITDERREKLKEIRKKQDITRYDENESTSDSDGMGGQGTGGGSDDTKVDVKGNSGGEELPVIEITGEDIIQGDSREIIKSLCEHNGRDIGAIVTDPPYGMDYDSRGDSHDVILGDESVSGAVRLTREVLKKARLILRNGSPIVVFCGDSNLKQMMELMEDWYDYKDVNVWDKDNIGTSQIGGTPIRWRPQHEYFVLGSYGSPRVENKNRHDGSVLKFKRLSGHNMDHPTEKPVKLLRYIIESLTDEGDVIFDPFAGSGSTLVAAKETGRGYVGIEYDEKYYNHIVQRLEQSSISTTEDKNSLDAWTGD